MENKKLYFVSGFDAPDGSAGTTVANRQAADMPDSRSAGEAWLRTLTSLTNEKRDRISGWLYGD